MPPGLRRRLPALGHGLHRLREAWKVLETRLERGLVDVETAAWIKRWSGMPGADLPDKALLVWAGKAWQVAGLGGEEIPAAWLPLLLLLHLPVLRSYWRRALRSQRFAWMSKALPRVWAVDPTPLKPGAVIAGLGIAAWEDLPRLLEQGRGFFVMDWAEGGGRQVDAAMWPGILTEAADKRLLLIERSAAEPEGALAVSWKRDENGRIVTK